MSHIVEIKTEIRDPVAMQAACQRLGLENPQQGTATLFTQQVSGWIVQLPEWRFPVVVDAGSGQVQYDNYEGRWREYPTTKPLSTSMRQPSCFAVPCRQLSGWFAKATYRR